MSYPDIQHVGPKESNGPIDLTTRHWGFRITVKQWRALLREIELERSAHKEIHGYPCPKYAVVNSSCEVGNFTEHVEGEKASPHSWEPECLAIPEEGQCYIAKGGNNYDGAKRWLPSIYNVVKKESEVPA